MQTLQHIKMFSALTLFHWPDCLLAGCLLSLLSVHLSPKTQTVLWYTWTTNIETTVTQCRPDDAVRLDYIQLDLRAPFLLSLLFLLECLGRQLLPSPPNHNQPKSTFFFHRLYFCFIIFSNGKHELSSFLDRSYGSHFGVLFFFSFTSEDRIKCMVIKQL